MNNDLKNKFEIYYVNPNGVCAPTYYARPAKLLDLMLRFNIKSLFDSGCKDRIWMRHNQFAENGIEYTGGDISSYMVAFCQQEFTDVPVILHDATTDAFPPVDLVFSSDVLIHLDNRNKLKFLNNIIDSNIPYLLMTCSGGPVLVNTDVELSESGFPFAHVKWSMPPWNFPEPLARINDDESDRTLNLWSLDQIKEAVMKVNL